MKKFGHIFILSSILGLVTACYTSEDSDQAPRKDRVELLDLADLLFAADGDTVVLDFYGIDREVGIYIDPTLDLSKVEIVCPNGQRMSFIQWAEKQAEEQGVELLDRQEGFYVANTADVPTNSARGDEGITLKCEVEVCDDGLVIITC